MVIGVNNSKQLLDNIIKSQERVKELEEIDCDIPDEILTPSKWEIWILMLNT